MMETMIDISDFLIVSVYSVRNLETTRTVGGNEEIPLNASFVLLIASDCELGRRDERRRPSVVGFS